MNDIQNYPIPGGNQEVILNHSTIKIYVSPQLTRESLLVVLAEHESLRINEYWEKVLMRPARSGAQLEGLTRLKGSAGLPLMKHFNIETQIKFSEKGLRGSKLNEYLKTLNLPEQRNLLKAFIPASREQLNATLRSTSAQSAYAPDFRDTLEKCGSPKEFIEKIAQAIQKTESPINHAPRYYELLIMLWSKNYVLLPLDFRNWTLRYKIAILRDGKYSAEKAGLVSRVATAIDRMSSTSCKGWAYTLLIGSSQTTESELSVDLIDAFEAQAFSTILSQNLNGNKLHTARSEITSACQTFRLIFNQANPDFAVSQTRSGKFGNSSQILKSDGKFLWLEIERPELVSWGEFMRLYVSQLTTARIAGQVTKLNSFGEYLISLPKAPLSPEAVDRATHIYDATLFNKNTYMDYLEQRSTNKSNASSTLSQLRSFFDWYADFLLAKGSPGACHFKNPVFSSDTFGTNRNNNGQTTRNSLPKYVLDELKQLITEDDFSFGRSQKSQYTKVTDNETKQQTRVFSPAVSICLYTMLDSPIRSHQSRWLDSGELDEFIFDKTSNTKIRNPNPNAIPRREECALRAQHDNFRNTNWFGLWVNTNKTALYDSVKVGYCIPYVSENLNKFLNLMKDWQKRYLLPMIAPIPYYADKHAIAERERIQDKGPQVTPIFRDPTALNPGSPINYSRLVSFYTNALAEVQNRIKRKYGHEVQLVRTYNNRLKWAVDLHTLRVSGITAMIESGVPLEIVSQFVAGHATLVMTLHYLRYSPLKIREILSEAHEKSLTNMDFLGSEAFMQNLDSFAPYLLGADGPGQGAGMSVLREKTGILSINSDGICPGTSCSTGGPVDSTKLINGPVPGGQRCGLCRYWLTGPAHLLGQITTVNSLAYSIRRKGMEIGDLNEKRIDAEDSQNQGKARKIRDRVDLLNRELAIDIEEWISRHRFAEQSIALLDQYIAASAPFVENSKHLAILTNGNSRELKITLEETHEFALLDQITQMCDFVTGFQNREAEFEKHLILSKMLTANGMKPFLLSLNEHQAREAGNLMSALLLQQIKSQDLDDVLHGRAKLAEYPNLARSLQALETAPDNRELFAKEIAKLQLGDTPEVTPPSQLIELVEI